MFEDNIIDYRVISGNKNEGFIPGPKTKRFPVSGMFICLQGTVKFFLDDNDFSMKKNDIVVYLPYSLLKIVEASEDLYGIMMSVDFNVVQPLLMKITNVDSLLNVRQRPVTNLSEHDIKAINNYIKLYQAHLQLSKQFEEEEKKRFWQLNNLQIENIKLNLLLQIIIAFADAENGLKNTVNRKDDIVRKFLNNLKDFYLTQHEVSFYANMQCISMRYFSTVIKQQTGQTPSQWITSVLVKEAKRLLTETNLSVKEISEKMNFPNQSYFGKWFKTQMGMAPLKFKKIENLK